MPSKDVFKMKGKLVTILFIIVFILLVAVIISLLTDGQDMTDINDFRLDVIQTDTPILVDIPTVQLPQTPAPTMLPLPTPPPTPVPTFIPTPSPIPTPIPTPVPTPVPLITDLGSGSFRSASPVYLNVIADWSAKAIDAQNVAVTVTVSVESYSLHLNASSAAVNVSFGDQYQTLGAPDLMYDGGLGVNQLATTTFTVPLAAGSSNSYNLGVAWHFGGWYMNMEIPSIECGGVVTLVR